MIDVIITVLQKHSNGMKAKDIARVIGADKKTINQILYAHPDLFSYNDKYEWSLHKASSPSFAKDYPSTKEVKEAFRGINIDSKDMSLLRNIGFDEFKKVANRYRRLLEHVNSSFPYLVQFSTVLNDILLLPDNQFSGILNNAKLLNSVCNVTHYDSWKTIVFSNNFSIILENIKDLNQRESSLTPNNDNWLKLIQSSSVQFNTYLTHAEFLLRSTTILPTNAFWDIVISADINKTRRRVETIVSLQKEKSFPPIDKYSNHWEIFINITDSKFSTCLNNAKRLYSNNGHLAKRVCSYGSAARSHIFDIILLNSSSFELFCSNFSKYKQSPIIESFSFKNWLWFFLQKQDDFSLSWLNTRKLDDEVRNGTISIPTYEAWLNCAFLTRQAFIEDITTKKQQHSETNQIHNMLKNMQNKSFRQCLGDCGVCKREICLLEQNTND